jgi:hypothetical protein
MVACATTIPASSGENVRYRLNRSVDRKLTALWTTRGCAMTAAAFRERCSYLGERHDIEHVFE